jgi:hypothetical protein
MWLRWLPWRFILSRVARSRGFIDPIRLLAQFNRFSEPAEVVAPVEILRAGIVLQARGFINSQAIQHNLDWVWPYWVEQQFDPRSTSFIPRAFSMSHINVTHRDWTAVGVPGCEATPIVDPRGLVMPYFDSWSLDFWIISRQSPPLFPSRMPTVRQSLRTEGNLAVVTESHTADNYFKSTVEVVIAGDQPYCRIHQVAHTATNATLVIALRPCNPEGISFVHKIESCCNGKGWLINGRDTVFFSENPDEMLCSDYKTGDVSNLIVAGGSAKHPPLSDNVGMATAGALYAIGAEAREIAVTVPLGHKKAPPSATEPVLSAADAGSAKNWTAALEGVCSCQLPERKMQDLFEGAVRMLVLHSPEDVFAGPYTYKRFWFRDAVLIANALLCANLPQRVARLIRRFPKRQTTQGYFLSQQGEWDSNGQVLWLLHRLRVLTNKPLDGAWAPVIRAAAEWIKRKRRATRGLGLLPPGFSAEHLGPNDCYYWDDFWAIAGLDGAAALLRESGDTANADRYGKEKDDLLKAVEASLRKVESRLGIPALPASPNRRLDSGAVGSLVASYPLQILPAADPRLINTAGYLLDKCSIDGALFHNISHAGINPYLTLHVAQTLLRAGDPRFREPMQRIAELASPTGQWAEAIHPQLQTGCMGDGLHVWAAAEWVMMVRNCLVREEHDGATARPRIILCSGVMDSWLSEKVPLKFGPTLTSCGAVTVEITMKKGAATVKWNIADPRGEPVIEIAFPQLSRIHAEAGTTSLTVDLGIGRTA